MANSSPRTLNNDFNPFTAFTELEVPIAKTF